MESNQSTTTPQSEAHSSLVDKLTLFEAHCAATIEKLQTSIRDLGGHSALRAVYNSPAYRGALGPDLASSTPTPTTRGNTLANTSNQQSPCRVPNKTLCGNSTESAITDVSQTVPAQHCESKQVGVGVEQMMGAPEKTRIVLGQENPVIHGASFIAGENICAGQRVGNPTELPLDGAVKPVATKGRKMPRRSSWNKSFNADIESNISSGVIGSRDGDGENLGNEKRVNISMRALHVALLIHEDLLRYAVFVEPLAIQVASIAPLYVPFEEDIHNNLHFNPWSKMEIYK